MQNNSGPMLSLKLAFIAISCAQSETVEEKSYSALLLTAADGCKNLTNIRGQQEQIITSQGGVMVANLII